ncbi:MAG TPA: PQQ-dependent sugar dehydrogenase [Solirubrobacterales bacterium]
MSSPRRLSVLVASIALAALIAGCGGGSPATGSTAAQGPPVGTGQVKLEKVGDFDQPDYVTEPPGSADLYVVERQGAVRIVRDRQVVSTPALDITDEVDSDGDEQGLLSIAFPPDFRTSRLVYAYYTGNDQDQHVVGYTVGDDGSFDRSSERELLHMDDFASNHNGGLLLFGPDRQLYIGTGDGGIADDPKRNGQNVDSLLGKILRIDPRPSDGHPYTVRSPGPLGAGALPEICDYGLRNPWRFSFDPGTGALLIGDVGQNTQEEIDYVPAERVCGNNFGWSAFEGTDRLNEDQTAPNEVPPILTYGHDEGGCSVTGGYVVRDRSLPALFGRYVYGDFCVGELRSFKPATPEARDERSLGLEVPSLSSFGQDNEGHIYAVSLDGPVYRLAQ